MSQSLPTDILAIIPVRVATEKSSAALLTNLSLLTYTIDQARLVPAIQQIVVATDHDEVMRAATNHGVRVIRLMQPRNDETGTPDPAFIMNALDQLHNTDEYEPKLVVLLQITTPFREVNDIQKAIAKLESQNADSLFSATRLAKPLWQAENDTLRDMRDQHNDSSETLIENGSIYVFKPEVLQRHQSFLGGKIAAHHMDALSLIQIDEAHDLEKVALLIGTQYRQASTAMLADIRLLVLDFDGVLTNNRALVDETGKEAVWVNRSDGWGIARLQEAGIPIIVISSEKNPVVAARCRKLNIEHIQGVGDKATVLTKLATERGLSMVNIAFVGNDVNDLEALRLVGIPIAVRDAYPEVLAAARLVLTRRGGDGAVREICDLIMKALDEESIQL